MKASIRVFLLVVLGVAPMLSTQAAETVMDNSKVTESSLVDALAVDEPQTMQGTTRGFRPANPNSATPAPKAAAPAAAAAPGRANLLITFLTGSATITAESQAVLDKVAAALQNDRLAGLTFRVEGHADARGNPQDNLRLSQQRAESVVNYLVEKHAILPERLVAQGKGSTEPLNKERADAPENRRVTVVTNRN